MQLPSILYKYTTASTAFLVLENSKLRWSSPLLFNDIAEFQRMPRFHPRVADSYKLLTASIVSAVFDGIELDEVRLTHQAGLLLNLVKLMASEGNITREDILKGLTGEVSDADDKIEVSLRDYVDKLGLSTARVLCVTSENDNNAMWGNYAENHAGCVFGFRHIAKYDTPLQAATRVSYSAERPIVGSGLDFLLYGNTPELRKSTLHAIFYTKDKSWAYEREWRVITWRPNEAEKQVSDFLFFSEELESVTLGARATVKTELRVRELLAGKYPDASLYRMELKGGKLVPALLS
ncbi:DUF2971 domain-containing protein [Pseudomonas sp. A-RE-26]|uniref:DUF2971 domain-containing protein n=1 Tax=Pseudomonas sp. A-RE-26 TaxID=2832402 RepID=UPI001CBFA543|nr:DUF2971 domain-containing protein [Pseudomonas sp. A-RE-26]